MPLLLLAAPVAMATVGTVGAWRWVIVVAEIAAVAPVAPATSASATETAAETAMRTARLAVGVGVCSGDRDLTNDAVDVDGAAYGISVTTVAFKGDFSRFSPL